MTEIWVSLTENSHILTANGHAVGNTQVCAAVSALLYALAGYLKNAGRRVYRMEEMTLQPGKACIRCLGDGHVRAAYEMTALGLLQIAKSYPESLSVHYLRENNYYRGEKPEKL